MKLTPFEMATCVQLAIQQGKEVDDKEIVRQAKEFCRIDNEKRKMLGLKEL